MRRFAVAGGVPQFKTPKGFEAEILGVLGLLSDTGAIMAVDMADSHK
jgi:hypothetical protein